MPATIRISPQTHRNLTEMARQTNSSLQEMLDRAIETQRRQLLLEQANQAYAKLRQNQAAWKAWRNELKELDGTLSDGI